MRSPVVTARYRVGRRGAFLLFLAVLDVLFGYSLIVAPEAFRAVSLFLPYPVWGWIWIGVGAVCAVSSVLVRDRAAFTLAAAIKASWAAVMTEVWLNAGVPLGWRSVVFWAVFAVTVLIISSWPEYDPPRILSPPAPHPLDEGAGGR